MENVNKLKWAATLRNVQEVSLAGTADLAYWKEHLLPRGLVPAETAGKARLLIIGGAAKYAGVRFQELSFSVLCRGAQASLPENAYLVQAFNSSRLFACCERVFFSTPYAHANVLLKSSMPAGIVCVQRGRTVFEVKMGSPRTAQALEAGEFSKECWEAAVFLPCPGRKASRARKLFIARVSGQCQCVAFSPESDLVRICAAPGAPLFQALMDSHFSPTEWLIRPDATHAKSRTYREEAVGCMGKGAAGA